MASSTVTIPTSGRRRRRPARQQVVAGDDARHVVVGRSTSTATGSSIMTSPIGVDGWATIRSRSDRTPTSGPSASTT